MASLVSHQASQRASRQPHRRIASPSARVLKRPSQKSHSPSKARICMGCKKSYPSYLFVGLFPRSLNNVTEKCFSCRRVDAVGDFIKTHAKSGSLSVADQMDHLDNQKDACTRWMRVMKNRGVDISTDEINAVLNAVKTHPALQKAVDRLSSEDDVQDNIETQEESTASTSSLSGSDVFIKRPRKFQTPTMELSDIDSTDTTPTAKTSSVVLESSDVEAAASALYRAADALDRVRHLPGLQIGAVLETAFSVPLKQTSVANWANVLANRVESYMLPRPEMWEQNEREAVMALMRMACG